jgi:hypothetical protein
LAKCVFPNSIVARFLYGVNEKTIEKAAQNKSLVQLILLQKVFYKQPFRHALCAKFPYKGRQNAAAVTAKK